MTWLRNATLRDGRTVDVRLEGGHIAEVVEASAPQPSTPRPSVAHSSIELRGYLLLPAFVEPHAHLDKALTADLVPNDRGDLVGAIDAWIAFAPTLTVEAMARRGQAAALELAASGVTAVRTHASVYPDWLTAVEAMIVVRNKLRGIIDIEIVALTTMQICGGESAYRHMQRSAMALDPAVIVGGCPHLDEDGERAIDVAIDLAGEAGRPLDLHTDEQLDPSVLGLRYFAKRVVETGFRGGATASHCVSLGMQTAAVQKAVAEETAAAAVAVITLPQTNLYLQGREHERSPPRGLTALRPLLRAGVTVAAGADNVRDPFNLMGRSDPLETAALLVMAGHLSVEEAFATISSSARTTLGLDPVTIATGAPADLVAVRAASLGEAMAMADQDRIVWRRGTLVARTTVERRFPRLGDRA